MMKSSVQFVQTITVAVVLHYSSGSHIAVVDVVTCDVFYYSKSGITFCQIIVNDIFR